MSEFLPNPNQTTEEQPLNCYKLNSAQRKYSFTTDTMDTHTMLSIHDGTPMDDARQMIYQEIQHCEHRILGLRSQLNMYASVARLPPEILLQIFAKLTEDGGFVDSMKCIPITHVCRRWRSLALDAPALWTNLSSENLLWTTAMLERSKSAPLTVLMDEMSHRVATPILKHLSRIISLTIEDWSAGELQTLHALIEDNAIVAPQLEVLSLSCDGVLPWSLPSTTFQQTHRLNNLFIDSIHIDWSHSPLFRNLTKLRVKTVLSDGQPTWRELISALDQMPSLKSLFLDDMLPTSPFDAAHDAVSTSLPNLQSVVFRRVPALGPVVTFLNHVELPQDLKVFTIVHVNGCSNRGEFHEFYDAINRSLPSAFSRAKYMNVLRKAIGDDDFGTILMECFATLRDDFYSKRFNANHETNPADIGLELSYSPRACNRPVILVDALDKLKLSSITHLRIGVYVGYPELLALLKRLPELQVIQVFEQATVHLTQALNFFQPRDAGEESLIMPKLTEIRVCRDYSPMHRKNSLFTDDTWQDLKAFLEYRQSLQAGLHKLYIRKCRYVSNEMVEGLKKCVGDLRWDGICTKLR
ncbi:hypothetical protein D9619_011763 [Psilocybe cf. subviscida]|uniref:F-box domain-containing protein n=1 Tax=Psilocybe cf. subviscida TaxID=2480587 RepID=A0A8H5B0W6_9AGAR|nr:hypothetical protein D9619_011763 [Psilocybe cf. subviscida]